MDFVTNFIRFPVVQKFLKSVKIWQSYREFKGGNVFETQCSNVVEISANSWKARFCLKKQWKPHWNWSKNADIILSLRCWTSGPLSWTSSVANTQAYKQKHHCFSSPVAVRAPISTKLCTRIEDAVPFLHSLTFLHPAHSFCARGPRRCWRKLPIAVFCLSYAPNNTKILMLS